MAIHGVIKKIVNEGPDGKRYGFIAGDDGRDYFFTPASIQKMIPYTFDDFGEGELVEFEPINHPKGPRALEVRNI